MSGSFWGAWHCFVLHRPRWGGQSNHTELSGPQQRLYGAHVLPGASATDDGGGQGVTSLADEPAAANMYWPL